MVKRGDVLSDVAGRYDVNPKELDQISNEIYRQAVEDWTSREEAKRSARKWGDMDAGRQAAVENAYRDWSTVDGWDDFASGFADTHEGRTLGLTDPTTAASQLWDIIREGAVPKPRRNDTELIQQAAQHIVENRRGRVLGSR